METILLIKKINKQRKKLKKEQEFKYVTQNT